MNTTVAATKSPFNKYVIEGVLTTLTPLNISEPSEARVDPATGRVTRFGDAGFPCTVTTHLRVVANAPDAVSLTGEHLPADDETVRRRTLESVPVVPANTLSGLLRRSAARIIFESLERRGVTIPLSYYNILCCGAFTGNPDKEAPGLAEIRAASHDPYFGVFGGGPRMYAKRTRVDTALPLCAEIAQFVPDSMASHIVHLKPAEMTQVLWARRGDDVSMMRNVEQMQSTITDFAGVMDEYLGDSVDRKASLSARSELKKTAAAARKSGDKVAAKAASEGVTESASRGVASLTATQVVSPGVPFHFRVELAGTDAQLGFLLLSVERFAQNQSLGGRVAKGFGRFRLHDLHLTTVGSDGEQSPVFIDGQHVLSEDFAAHVSAAKAVVDAYTTDTLAIFCEQKSKPSRAGKAGEPAAESESEQSREDINAAVTSRAHTDLADCLSATSNSSGRLPRRTSGRRRG